MLAPGDIRQNIRTCRHYIEVLEEGARDSQIVPSREFKFALQCCADPDLPTKEAVVLRQEDFSNLEEFKARIREFLARWLAELTARAATA